MKNYHERRIPIKYWQDYTERSMKLLEDDTRNVRHIDKKIIIFTTDAIIVTN